MIKELTMELKKLSEIGSIFNGNSINAKLKKEKYLNIENGIPYIATKDVSYESRITYNNGIKIPFLEKTNFKVAPKDTVLICAEGGSAGRKIGFTNQEVCFGNKLFAFSANNNIESKYVYHYYFSDAFQKAFKSQMTGIIGGVSMNKFKNLEIPLPPLHQQKQIVAILDKAFAAIDTAKANAEQNLLNAKELFESYLQGVFENKGDDWQEYELSEVVEDRCSLSYGIVQPGNDYTNGLPVIRPTDMKAKFVDHISLKLIDPARADSYKRTTLIGDELLLCVRGTTGLISLITDELKGANVTRGIVPICFNTDMLSLQFGYYLFASNYVQKQIKDKTYGAALMQINIRDVRKLLMRIPSRKEQEKIVLKLDALSSKGQKLEAIYTKKLNDLEELKKSILQQAFSGQLTTN